jgi:hypothetical protein
MCCPWLATLTSGIINNKVLFLDELEIFYLFVRIVDTFFKPKYISSLSLLIIMFVYILTII